MEKIEMDNFVLKNSIFTYANTIEFYQGRTIEDLLIRLNLTKLMTKHKSIFYS